MRSIQNTEEGIGVVLLRMMGKVFLLLAQSFLASMRVGWRLQMVTIVSQQSAYHRANLFLLFSIGCDMLCGGVEA